VRAAEPSARLDPYLHRSSAQRNAECPVANRRHGAAGRRLGFAGAGDHGRPVAERAAGDPATSGHAIDGRRAVILGDPAGRPTLAENLEGPWRGHLGAAVASTYRAADLCGAPG